MKDNAIKLSITLYHKALDGIDAREGPRSSVINESLERYFEVLKQECKTLRKLLSDDEIGLVVDVVKDSLYYVPVLFAEVRDYIDTVQERNVDRDALINKLNGLSYTQTLALLDAAERYWNRVNNGELLEPKNCLS